MLTLIFIIFFVTLVEIPALILLAIWFILQFIPALGQVAVETGGGEGVAYFAHVGGFVFGLAVAGVMLSVTAAETEKNRRDYRSTEPNWIPTSGTPCWCSACSSAGSSRS